MLSSGVSMEDSFKVRVDRVFGSLASSQSPSLRSVWSLTDDEVEKREWIRERSSFDREEIPSSSSFDGFFANEQKISRKNSRNVRNEFEEDRDDLNDDDEEDENEGRGSFGIPDEHDKDTWEIRSSIGLDCTLDNEEEEDEFDKMAFGRENAGDRLYMKDVTDYGPDLNSHNVLPSSFKVVARDPRANHSAAKIRLKEDEEKARNSDSQHASDKTIPGIADPQFNPSEDIGNLKPILKRKENKTDAKSRKRVRFDMECKDDFNEDLERPQHFPRITQSTTTVTVPEDGSSLSQDAPVVPDYVRNPSKYTCYSLESTGEDDEDSNRCAYMDFLNLIRRSNVPESMSESSDLPKSVTFTPRKKTSDAMMSSSPELKQNQGDTSKDLIHRTGFPVRIAAGEAEESEVCAMDEDEVDTNSIDKSGSSRKPGRQYRTKAKLEDAGH